MRAAGFIVAAAILGGAAPAGAQRALTVAPLVSLAEHRVDAGFGVERSLGPIVGAVGTLRVGPRLEVAGRAAGGRLIGSPGGPDPDAGRPGGVTRRITGPRGAPHTRAARRGPSAKHRRPT